MNKFVTVFFCFISIFLLSSLFVVQEGQKGIVLRFGNIFHDNYRKIILYEPGLHFKFSFFDSVKILDARIQTTHNESNFFINKEQKNIIVNLYIKWKIIDFNRYYVTTHGNQLQAEILLKHQFDDRLRCEIKKRNNIQEINFNRKFIYDIKNFLNNKCIHHNMIKKSLTCYSTNLDHINDSDFSDKMERNVISCNNTIYNLGIKIVDIDIERINLPTSVVNSIYNRMKVSYQNISNTQYLKEQKKIEQLSSKTNYKVRLILDKARHQALIIKGEADSESARLFSNIDMKDIDFYIFLHSLNSYKKIFSNTQSLLIFNLDNNFFKNLTNLNK